jgi:atypical dual specificity phosphatase
MELGAYLRWVYARLFGKPMNFSFIDEYVAGSAGPLSLREVNWLKNKKGIRAILSVKEGPLAKLWVEGIEYLNVPVKNHFPPTLGELRTCVDFVVAQSAAKRKVAVHCQAGKGRTGTVLAAYLVRVYGLQARDAIARIRKLRRGSIERGQEAIIQEYAEDVAKMKR